MFAFNIAHGLPPPSVNIQQRAGNRGGLSISFNHEDKEKQKRYAYRTGQNETKRDNLGWVYEYSTETNGTSEVRARQDDEIVFWKLKLLGFLI